MFDLFPGDIVTEELGNVITIVVVEADGIERLFKRRVVNEAALIVVDGGIDFQIATAEGGINSHTNHHVILAGIDF